MIGAFKKNSYLVGAIIALSIPIVLGFIIFVLSPFFKAYSNFQYHKFLVLSIIPNVLLIRYYLKVARLEKTAKAIIFITFLLALLYFIYESQLKTIIY